MLADKPTRMQQWVGRMGAVQCPVTGIPDQELHRIPKGGAVYASGENPGKAYM